MALTHTQDMVVSYALVLRTLFDLHHRIGRPSLDFSLSLSACGERERESRQPWPWPCLSPSRDVVVLLNFLNVSGGRDPYGGGGGGDPYGGYGEDPYGGGPGGKAGAEAKELSTVDEIKAFIAEEDSEPAIIGFFDATSNAEDKEVFDELVSKEGSNYRFAVTTAKVRLRCD
jgi:hypothetical protein